MPLKEIQMPAGSGPHAAPRGVPPLRRNTNTRFPDAANPRRARRGIPFALSTGRHPTSEGGSNAGEIGPTS